MHKAFNKSPIFFSKTNNFVNNASFQAKPQIRDISISSRGKKRVTLIPGEGIGPEVTQSVVGIFRAAGVPIEWEIFDQIFDPITLKENPQIFQDLVASISRNRVALKGPLYTPYAKLASRNLKLRTSLDLFANVVPCRSVPGLHTRYSDTKINLVVIRENTQGEYTGFEQKVEPGVVQSLKVITEHASRRVAEYAFEYALKENRKKITAIHKANIQKATDGLFIRTCKEVSKNYPQISYDEMIIDNCCMQLAMNPSQFDVMLTPNLYGNIITNVAAGLIGGPGLTPGANVGDGIAVFESGARHVGADIAGLNQANPTAFILSSAMLLRYLDMPNYAQKIEEAVQSIISEGKTLTKDIGGSSSTKQFTSAVINRLD